MQGSEPSDAVDLARLAAWRDGDDNAGNALVQRHFDLVYRFFAGKVPDPGELVQRTFLACIEGRARMDGVRRFRPYLLGIARNQLRMLQRREATAIDRLGLPSYSLPANATSPSGVVARRESHHVLLAAIRRLPIDQQLTLELYYWEGMGVEDVALVLDAPVGTVKARLFRARQQLGRHLASLADAD